MATSAARRGLLLGADAAGAQVVGTVLRVADDHHRVLRSRVGEVEHRLVQRIIAGGLR